MTPLIGNTDLSTIQHHIHQQDDTIEICSDGGLKDNIGSYGTAYSINGMIMAETKGRVPHTYNKLTSQRCESYGVLSAITMHKQIHKHMDTISDRNVHIRNVSIYCDCEALVNSINKWKNREWTTKFQYMADADTIKQIMQEYRHLQSMDVQVKFIHVRGHQDRIKRDLTYPEQMNVYADNLATAALRIRNNPDINLPSLQVKITMDGKQITANYTSVLREAYSTISLREHLKTANNWNDQTVEKIWWQPLGTAMNARPAGEHRTLVKFLHNRLPCNRKQKRYYGYVSANCNLCIDIEEDQNHILQCPNCEQRQTKRSSYLSELERYFEQTHTNIETSVVIMNHLKSWLYKLPMPDLQILIPEASNALKKAVQEQSNLGWDHWFKGRLTSSWGILYNNDLNNTNHGMRNETAEKWSRQIIEKTLDFVLSSWTIRNEQEHSTEGDQVQNQKDRLIAKIMWTKTKIINFPTSYLNNITEERIQDLPLGNLKMMDSQIQTLKRASGRPAAQINT
jgi:ribonuclease HI